MHAKILLIGCGALGCVSADLLARAGIGFIRIVDRDLVELGNLQRQTLFDERHAREQMPKAIAAAHRLKEINSSIIIGPIVADANSGNIREFATGIDLIIDGSDNVATRYLINDLCVSKNIPWIYGACVGTTGRVMPIVPKKTACLRCVFPEPAPAGSLPTCDVAGILAGASATVGAMQATLAIRLIVKGDENLGGLTSFDIWTSEFRKMPSADSPQSDCPCCARREFPFLENAQQDWTTALCGRDTVQLQLRHSTIDLKQSATKLSGVGSVQTTPWFVRCRLHEPAGMELTVFPDSRVLVKGTTDFDRARSIYARFVGI